MLSPTLFSVFILYAILYNIIFGQIIQLKDHEFF